jgi:hypothetical protein
MKETLVTTDYVTDLKGEFNLAQNLCGFYNNLFYRLQSFGNIKSGNNISVI